MELAAILRDEAIRVISANRSGSRPPGTENLATIGLRVFRLALDLAHAGHISDKEAENLIAASASFAGEYLLDANVAEAESLLERTKVTGDPTAVFHCLRILAESPRLRASALIQMTLLELEGGLLDRRDSYLMCILSDSESMPMGVETAMEVAQHLSNHEVRFSTAETQQAAEFLVRRLLR
ncbi:MAG: hypothetical protein HONBIEJF_02369 [Fimbriimonadaceae bacterium]|nr:hypothetical protein [Fimbriimonadaceae bacterium]